MNIIKITQKVKTTMLSWKKNEQNFANPIIYSDNKLLIICIFI